MDPRPGSKGSLFLAFLLVISEFPINTIQQSSPKLWKPSEFDFIIVGAGSAGAVIANRLSENPNTKVLLLEAGKEPHPDSEIPLLANTLWGLHEIDWFYEIEPQEHACQGFTEKKWPWNRGRALGGSSAINAMIYTRGNRRDYDQWAAEGNPGWAYDDIFKYFLKLEDYQVPHTKYDAMYHATGGPITVTTPPYSTPLANAFMEGGREMGYYVNDYNAETQKGFMRPPFNNKNGARWGTYRGYVEPASRRPNLQIVTDAFVTKVIMDGKKRATGVAFQQQGTLWIANAKKEVILSAGAVSTPQILLLSGIGAKETLDKFQIEVVADIPGVGQNLQDHVALYGVIFHLEQPVAIKYDRVLTDKAFSDYHGSAIGPLTVPVAVEGISFMDSKLADPNIDWPDVELIMVSNDSLHNGIPLEVYNDIFAPIDGKDTFNILPVMMRPKSRGFMTLRSSDPHDRPIFQPNYLSEQEDVDILVEALKLTLQLGKTKAFGKFGARFHDKMMPGCEHLQKNTDEYWECFVRTYSIGFYHQCGTAKMGPKTDGMAVVDHRLRVHGISGLRVADASIMPYVITGHTNVPCIMIGEKVSDMIKEDWLLHQRDEL